MRSVAGAEACVRIHLRLLVVGRARWLAAVGSCCCRPAMRAGRRVEARRAVPARRGAARASLALPARGSTARPRSRSTRPSSSPPTACLGRAGDRGSASRRCCSLDALGRCARWRQRGAPPCERRDRAVHRSRTRSYLGGLSGGLLALWSRVFGVEPSSARGRERLAGAGARRRVPDRALSRADGAAARSAGSSLARVGAAQRASASVAEATLLPLASAIVLIWDPHRPVPFALLGGTYLLVNFGFNRLAQLARGDAPARASSSRRSTAPRTRSARRSRRRSSCRRSCARPRARCRRRRGSRRWCRIGGERRALRARAAARDRGARPSAQREALAAWREARWLEACSTRSARSARAPGRCRSSCTARRVGALVAESADARRVRRRTSCACSTPSRGQAAAAVENARLYALANVDGLTGLYCRRYFDIRVAEEIERARRFGTSFALVMLDLDDFKRLNDTLGHLAGDRALREVAADRRRPAARRRSGGALRRRGAGVPAAAHLAGRRARGRRAHPRRGRRPPHRRGEPLAHHRLARRGRLDRVGRRRSVEPGRARRRRALPRQGRGQEPRRDRPRQLRAHAVARAGPPPPRLAAQCV